MIHYNRVATTAAESRSPATGARSPRVAIIAIHGVADQKLGETSRALAELLIAEAPNGFQYQPGVPGEVMLQVPMLEPLHAVDASQAGIRKQFRQSAGSDFLRERKTAAGNKRSLAQRSSPLSIGAEFTDYLLAKAKQNATPTDTYSAPQVRLSRRKDGASDSVDICEMYWADLSRLSGGAPRILTELFTLLFRLSTLGRDTVQTQAAAAGFATSRAWRTLRWTQTTLDWMYSRVLALLFLQLVMLALILVPFGLALSHARAIHVMASVLAAGLLGLWLLYRLRMPAVAFPAGLALGGALLLVDAAWMDGLAWIAILSVFYDWWMRVCEERFRMVRKVGWVLWIVVLLAIVWFAAKAPSVDLAMWVTGALSALEVVLLLIVLWWAISAPLLLVWLVASVLATRMPAGTGDERATGMRAQARSTVGTARMGFFVSLGFFVLLAMTAWALVTTGVERSVDLLTYSPIIFTQGTSSSCITAALFLHQRFVNSTEAFSAIALLLLPVIAYLASMLTPSALAEVGFIVKRFDRLGRWLTGGYRSLEGVVAGVVALGVAAAMLTGITLVAFRLGQETRIGELLDWVKPFAVASQDWLKYFVIGAGTATVALSAVGGVWSSGRCCLVDSRLTRFCGGGSSCP